MDSHSKILYNELIINERLEDIKEINKDVLLLNEIIKDLNELVKEQDNNIHKIENNIDDVRNKTEDSVKNIEKAKEYQSNSINKRLKLLGLGIIGMTINAPLTALYGVKIGLVASVSTIGALGIYKLMS